MAYFHVWLPLFCVLFVWFKFVLAFVLVKTICLVLVNFYLLLAKTFIFGSSLVFPRIGTGSHPFGMAPACHIIVYVSLEFAEFYALALDSPRSVVPLRPLRGLWYSLTVRPCWAEFCNSSSSVRSFEGSIHGPFSLARYCALFALSPQIIWEWPPRHPEGMPEVASGGMPPFKDEYCAGNRFGWPTAKMT